MTFSKFRVAGVNMEVQLNKDAAEEKRAKVGLPRLKHDCYSYAPQQKTWHMI